MKRVYLVVLFHIFYSNFFAQTVQEIKSDPSVFWAEGSGDTFQEADEMALTELSRKVSVTVSVNSSQYSIVKEGEEESSWIYDTKINSNAVFNNIEMRIITEKPQFRVLRWINKSEIEKQQEERTAKLQEMVRIANNALNNKQISDAIRYYYWAYVLLNTLPNQTSINIEDENYDIQAANLWLPNKLKQIFQNLSFSVVGKSEDGINDYNILFLYQDKPLSNIDYTYFDGTDWSPVCTATDGKSIVELRPSYAPENLMIKYEYKFEGEARSDKEIEKILGSVHPSFDTYCNGSAKLLGSKKEIQNVTNQFAQIEKKEDKATQTLSISKTDFSRCDNIMRQVINAIRNKNYYPINDYFTPNGYDVFNRLINYGNGRLLNSEPTLNYSQLGEDIVCRSLPMNFTFSGNRKFSEDVVFIFNKEGLIDNISFGLGKVALDNLMGNVSSSFTPEKSAIIANFLECFKTAYALKRLDYIEQLFDDDAIIITGKVLNKLNRSQGDGSLYQNNQYVELTKQDKATYIKHLKRSFASKEFINIKFANNRIRHTKVDGIYAIQIKQDYFSSNYGDTGYLFLLVDIRNPREPIIHIRAWQEKPDPEWGIIGPEFF